MKNNDKKMNKVPNKKQGKSQKKKSRKKQPENDGGFCVVGVGASAGGLSAFSELLSKIPNNAGLSFVIIQHLSPTAESNLSKILSTRTGLSVTEAKDNISIEPDHVYIIPPNKNIIVENNILKLSPRKNHEGLNLPIDIFFSSLAKDKQNGAIGLLLSGTGSDGTMGMKAIRESGGITLAQNASAEFPGMPNNAIKAKVVDYVLEPAEMAKKLVQIAENFSARHSAGIEQDQDRSLSDEEKKDLKEILALIHGVSDVDFTYYKHGTIKRRVMRRMLLSNINNLHQYAEYLKENPKEIELLYHDILIKVTDFFRDKPVFEFLKREIFPKLFKSDPSSIRIWVPGCATGEEVYSLAISLAEFMEENKKNVPVQIFGTDISEIALNTARRAKYPEIIEASVPPKILNKFFKKVDDGYEVVKNIRAVCVFSRHNIIADIPFSKMDIVSCRNVLIYLDSLLQKRAFPIFHYALNPDGFLILGTAETATSFQDLFEPSDKNQKVYVKKLADPHVELGLRLQRPNPTMPSIIKPKEPIETAAGIEKKADTIILSRHAPAGIIINDDLTIIQFRGDVSPYLKPVPGRATLDLVKMAHRSLLAKILEILAEVKKSGATVSGTHSGTGTNIEIIPLNDDKPSKAKHYLILFQDDKSRSAKNSQTKKKTETKEGETSPELEQELTSTIAQLQSLLEAKDATNEELRSAHEELMSANEEFQSINEELETTKEELQSTTEELLTLNAELQNRSVGLKKTEEAYKEMAPQFKAQEEDLRRKNEFISVLGHELRNPLAPITHSLELAELHGINDPEIKQLMGAIKRQVKLLNDMINGLLDVARATGGKIELQLESVDFNTVVNHAVETTQPLIKDRKHELELHFSDKPIHLLIDPLRVEQIIINLINNAAKYTPPDGKIIVKVTREDDTVVLSVKDNGIGISEEMLPKIFDMFSQATQSLSDFKGGLGVGLMLARTLAELHGGSLTASSAGLDKGSEFILRLPIKEGAINAKKSEDLDIKNVKLEKRKIIIVDDNVALADVLGKLLRTLNQDVTVKYDGASVIEEVGTNKPDVIFIDISMPLMSGYELIKILRKDLGLKKTKMVALSGFGEEFRQKSEEAGFDDHITKPISISDMKKILSEKND